MSEPIDMRREERDAEWRAATDRERVLITERDELQACLNGVVDGKDKIIKSIQSERDALRREVEALETIIEDHDWGDQ